eukprot:scaffold41861_cov17-Cyclotella_meneghiniana.AAC.1
MGKYRYEGIGYTNHEWVCEYGRTCYRLHEIVTTRYYKGDPPPKVPSLPSQNPALAIGKWTRGPWGGPLFHEYTILLLLIPGLVCS